MLPELITPIPGPKSQELGKRLQRVECRNNTLITSDWPIFWKQAKGANIWDVDGNRFLDLNSSFGVVGLGHGATQLALQQQAQQLLHAMGDVHPAEIKVQLAEALSQVTFERWTGRSGKCIFGNSGFEAVEAAMKTAVLATGKNHILSFEGAYHGLGYGALLACGQAWFRKPFEAQLAQVHTTLPFPEIDNETSIQAFRNHLNNTPSENLSAILVEPVQGRGGIRVPHATFLQELRDWCDGNKVLLIVDEIYTGFYRTGTYFACEGIIPDLICLGKALSGGFPISVCIGKSEIMDAWPISEGEAIHTSTFLGNPLGCAMALNSLDQFKNPEVQKQVAMRSSQLDFWLNKINSHSSVQKTCGKGLMRGIEFRNVNHTHASTFTIQLMIELLKQGMIVLPESPQGNILAIAPPFCITEEELDWAMETIMKRIHVLALN